MWVAAFVFTRCATHCVVLSRTMARLQHDFAGIFVGAQTQKCRLAQHRVALRGRRGVELAARFESWVTAEAGWEVCAPRPFSGVCFRLEGDDDRNRALLEHVNATGEIFLSHAVLNGRYVLRLAIGQMNTTEEDVRRAWEVLVREAAGVG